MSQWALILISGQWLHVRGVHVHVKEGYICYFLELHRSVVSCNTYVTLAVIKMIKQHPHDTSSSHFFPISVNIYISHTVLMAKCFCFYMQRFNFLSFFCFVHVKNVWRLFTFTLVQTSFFFLFFKDDSITQATGRASENFSDYNPFSAMEMVSSAGAHVTRVCHGRCHWAAPPFFLPPRRARTQTRPSPCPLRPPSRPSCRRLWSRVRKWVAHTCRDQDLETVLSTSLSMGTNRVASWRVQTFLPRHFNHPVTAPWACL